MMKASQFIGDLRFEPVVAREIAWQPPQALAPYLQGRPFFTLLESSRAEGPRGRYSFMAADPLLTLKQVGGQLFLNNLPCEDNLLEILGQLLEAHQCEALAGLPPFQGGVAGYIAYDFGRWLEPALQQNAQPSLGPEVYLHVYPTILAFDHLEKRAFILSLTGEAGLRHMGAILAGTQPPLKGHGILEGWQAFCTRAEYEAKVQKTIDYILAGDIFQANLAQAFRAKIPPHFNHFLYYQALSRVNPAPFAAYLNYGDIVVASSSPERLVSLRDGLIEARPIKGTIHSVPDPAGDLDLQNQLRNSAKDRAENVMIVDLLRNDLSRCAEPFSVEVPQLCGLESYAGLHHLTSVVTAKLKAKTSVGQLVAALFPGGSITGAPKIRAMQIIAELEPLARGVYCGSIGYFSFTGAIDFNIAIRTLQFTYTQALVFGGGGITARSKPCEEYEETLVKLQRIFQAGYP